jgi:hypothetical protein
VVNKVDPSGTISCFASEPCNNLISAFRMNNISEYMSLTNKSLFDAKVDIFSDYVSCKCELKKHCTNDWLGGQWAALEIDFRLFINGYNLKQFNQSTTQGCLASLDCAGLPFAERVKIARRCLPLKIETESNIFTSGPINLDSVVGTNPDEDDCSPMPCSFKDLFQFDTKTIGLIVSVSGYLGGGAGAGFVILTDGTGRYVVYATAEGGIGGGGQAKVLALVRSEATLDQYTGFTLNAGAGLLTFSGGATMSIDGLCNFTETGGLGSTGIDLAIGVTSVIVDTKDLNKIGSMFGKEVRSALERLKSN